MPDDLSGLDAEFQRRLENYLATEFGEDYRINMAEKEACFDRTTYMPTPEAAPLDDPWFWPNDIQPMSRDNPGELEPFWR